MGSVPNQPYNPVVTNQVNSNNQQGGQTDKMDYPNPESEQFAKGLNNNVKIYG